MANFRLRFSYSELGLGALLSHLEMQRALTRLVRRAALPIVLTQGFSPHMKLATGPALPVGVASVAEYADVELSRFVKPAEALARLQAAAPPLLPVLGCAYVNPKSPSLDAWLDGQTLELRISDADEQELSAHFESVRTGPELEIERKGKLRRYLPADFVPRPAEITRDGTGWVSVRFAMLLPSGGALRSDVFAEALLKPWEITPWEAALTRVELFHYGTGGVKESALPQVSHA